MKVKIRDYLKNVKPILINLRDELLKDFSYVSILASDCLGKRYITTRSTTNITDANFIERGVVVRVYNGTNYSEYAFTDISEDKINDLVSEIKSSIDIVNKVEEVKKYEELMEEEAKFSKSFEIGIDPRALGDEKIINKMIGLKNMAPKDKVEILDFRVIYEYLDINKLFISKKRVLEQGIMWSNSLFLCIAANEKGTKISRKSYSGIKGAEILNEMESGIEEVINNTFDLLNAERLIPGQYDVICSPDITGLIAHESFGHGIEMDMVLKDRAKAKDYMGAYVASPIVTMHDGAAAIKQTGSYFFDDEGNLATDTIIIDNGILVSGINDSLTALALNIKPTGNGRRERVDRKAYSRMTNTFISPGEDELEYMINSIEYGFLIDEAESGMEDPKNWGIQCIANIAREIKGGELTGRIFSPVIITGFVPDLLKSITMVSKKIEISGTGYCGKGYKEFVKVSDGGPYIKCRVRLG